MEELGDTVVLDTALFGAITPEEYNRNYQAFHEAKRLKMEEALPKGTKSSFAIEPIDPCGYLFHEPTKTRIAVYFPMKRFHKLMIRLCFGLEYVEVNK